MSAAPSELMSVGEAAAYLGVTAKHIWHAVQHGAIGHSVGPRRGTKGPRFVLHVDRADLDRVRNDGFFRPRPR